MSHPTITGLPKMRQSRDGLTALVVTMLTPEEHAAVKEAAARAGVALQSFSRAVLCHAAGISAPDAAPLPAALAERVADAESMVAGWHEQVDAVLAAEKELLSAKEAALRGLAAAMAAHANNPTAESNRALYAQARKAREIGHTWKVVADALGVSISTAVGRVYPDGDGGRPVPLDVPDGWVVRISPVRAAVLVDGVEYTMPSLADVYLESPTGERLDAPVQALRAVAAAWERRRTLYANRSEGQRKRARKEAATSA